MNEVQKEQKCGSLAVASPVAGCEQHIQTGFAFAPKLQQLCSGGSC